MADEWTVAAPEADSPATGDLSGLTPKPGALLRESLQQKDVHQNEINAAFYHKGLSVLQTFGD